ncbi:MAG: hypothetical protein Q9162_004578 [Coniocarpon cinnabarinum]
MSAPDPADLSAALLTAFQSRFNVSSDPAPSTEVPSQTKVLDSASYVASQAIDVFIDRTGVQAAARSLLSSIRRTPFTTASWSAHQLHPDPLDGSMTDSEIVKFIFVMDLLNFSFWSEDDEGFWVEWEGRRWSGYWSLVACLRRAKEEGMDVTDVAWWRGKGMATMRYVFGGGGGVRRKPKWLKDQERRGEIPGGVIGDGDGQIEPPDAGRRDEAGMHPASEDFESASLTEATDAEASISEAVGHGAHDEATTAAPEQSRGFPEGGEMQIELQAASGAPESRPTSKAEDEKTLVDEESASEQDDIDDDETIDGTEAKEMPMLRERLECLREARKVLIDKYDGDPVNLVQAARKSAGRLVNLLARDFSCFKDIHVYEGYKVRFQKRAQIFAADLWACFQGRVGSPGEFEDIERLTAFADYRIPQMLNTMGVLSYAPPVDARIRRSEMLNSGGSWEVQLRGCSVWAVELLKQEITRLSEDEGDPVELNAVLLDFHLYDTMKALETEAQSAVDEGRREGKILTNDIIPHHRTRSIWY